MLKFDPMKPAAEMTAVELMAAHVLAGGRTDVEVSGTLSRGQDAAKIAGDTYDELNRRFSDETPAE